MIANCGGCKPIAMIAIVMNSKLRLEDSLETQTLTPESIGRVIHMS